MVKFIFTYFTLIILSYFILFYLLKILYIFSLFLIGFFSNNSANGFGIELNQSNIVIYQGEFKSELKSGIGYEIENGNISYQGEFSNGKRNGYGTIKYAELAFYFGEWKNGFKHGYVILIIKNFYLFL
jgi:hypothetical protein